MPLQKEMLRARCTDDARPVNTLNFAFVVTAFTALIAGVAGPTVSFLVARQQTRTSLISGNRERWAETLRDAVAEYVALVLSASIARQGLGQDLSLALGADPALLPTAKHLAMVKSKILLMINPDENGERALCQAVEGAYLALVGETPPGMAEMRAQAEAITRAGRAVLRAQWHRVKRGD